MTSWSPTAPDCRRRRAAAAREEELLVAQSADGAELALSLYLDPALLQRLARADPLESLNAGNVADCLTALEGVSHFLYLAWNAGHDRPVSVLELEMQAEVDKFVTSHLLLRRQWPGHFPLELRRLLFERARPDPRLDAARAGLYREASSYAARFCRRLERGLARTRARALPERSGRGGVRGVAALLSPDATRASARTSNAPAKMRARAPFQSGSSSPLRLRASRARISLMCSDRRRRSVRAVPSVGLRGGALSRAARARA